MYLKFIPNMLYLWETCFWILNAGLLCNLKHRGDKSLDFIMVIPYKKSNFTTILC